MVQHVTVLIYRPPQIMAFALDGENHLIHVPLVTKPRTATAELVSIRLAKLAVPLANGFIGHDDPTFQQQLFHIPKTEAEPKV
jgi:hypothetical protein